MTFSALFLAILVHAAVGASVIGLIALLWLLWKDFSQENLW